MLLRYFIFGFILSSFILHMTYFYSDGVFLHRIIISASLSMAIGYLITDLF